MRLLGLLALAFCLTSGVGSAQDLRRVTSPNGELEFRLFLAPQIDRTFFRLAYQVDYRHKPLLATSYLGLDIWDQEPLLGENTGLIASEEDSKPAYRGLIATYMQNGSLARVIRVDVRVFNSGVAFRYQVLPSAGMFDLIIADEMTEFVPAAGAAKVSISEVRAPRYPAMHLDTEENGGQITRLVRLPDRPGIAFEGKTPYTTSWRVISIGAEQISKALLN